MASSLESLAPGFLIATPVLRDPNFDHAVVLMCVHNDQGAMGLVINRPSRVKLRNLMEQLGITCKTSTDQSVLIGGPVAVQNGMLIYENDCDRKLGEDELEVHNTLRLCPNQELLRAIGSGKGPQRFQIFLGHAGWGPGQLEQEISQGTWIPTKLDRGVLFDTPLEERWTHALESEGLHPGLLGSFRPQS